MVWALHFTVCRLDRDAIVIFMLFKRVKIGNRLSRFILILSPSMFSVYLFSGFRDRFHMMGWVVDRFSMMPLPISCVAAAAIVFFACCIVDIPRRVFIKLFNKR